MPGLNASQHLLSLGWAGPGHPLNPDAYKQKGSRGLAYDPSQAPPPPSSNSSYFAAGGNGLIRPLLVSKKSGNLGLGKRAHEPQRGNEWWLKGFEAALAGTGSTNTSRTGSGASTPKARSTGEELQRTVTVQSGRFGGLYGYFVKGETVGGTLGDENRSVTGGGKKRKSEVLHDDDDRSNTVLNEEQDGSKKKRKKRRGDDDDGEAAKAAFSEIAAFMNARDDNKSAKKDARRRKLRDSEQLRVAEEWSNIKDDGQSQPQQKRTKITARPQRRDGDTDEALTPASAPEAVNGDDDSDKVGRSSTKDKSLKRKQRRRRRVITDADGVDREETPEERQARRAARRLRRRRKMDGEMDIEKVSASASADTSGDGGEEEKQQQRKRKKKEEKEEGRRKRRGDEEEEEEEELAG